MNEWTGMYINTASYSSRIDEVCLHKNTLRRNKSRGPGCTIQTWPSTNNYLYFIFLLPQVKTFTFKTWSEGCSLSRTNLLTILPFPGN